jgi:CBS-domain-containing membrane protein
MLQNELAVTPNTEKHMLNRRFKKHFIPLAQSTLKEGVDLRLVDVGSIPYISRHVPAIEVMTDLRNGYVLTIGKEIQIDRASGLMGDLGIRFLVVTDNRQRLLGLLTLADILSEKPIRLVHDRRLHHSEILVEDVMVAIDNLYIMELNEVSKATAGKVFETLKGAGRQYAIVIDRLDNDHRQVSGIFSTAELARRLRAEYHSPPVSRSFAEIEFGNIETEIAA